MKITKSKIFWIGIAILTILFLIKAFYPVYVYYQEVDFGLTEHKEIESSVSSFGVDDPLPIKEDEVDTLNGDIALSSVEEIKAYIVEVSEEYGVNSELSLKIAECESQFRNVCNERYGCVSGIGVFQILQSTFDETVKRMESHDVLYFEKMPDVYNIKDNIDVAIWLMSQGLYEKWEMSSHCWESTYFRVKL